MRSYLSLVVRKPDFGVSDLVRHKRGCTATEDGQRLEISDLDRRGIVLSLQRKTKALISFAVTAKLICAFVFAYAKSWFSHDTAHLILFVWVEALHPSQSTIFQYVRTIPWVEPVLSNEDEASCSRTQHRTHGEIRTRNLAIRVWHSNN